MALPTIGPKKQGVDFNSFTKVSVSATSFSTTDPDVILSWQPRGMIFNTEGSSTNTVEYSFNGTTVHGELVPGGNRATLTFYDRCQAMIWFRVKSGSTGPITVSVEAWSQQ